MATTGAKAVKHIYCNSFLVYIVQKIAIKMIDYFTFFGPILESKGMGTIFQNNGKEMLEKGKIFENFGKNAENLKIFCKRAGDCML